MNEPIHIISMGAGVQSSTMALMAARGELKPMPHSSVFADTQCEPEKVYQWIQWLESQLPFPNVTVSKGNLFEDTLSERVKGKFLRIDIPAYIFHEGKNYGFANLSCTRDYKIKPIQAYARSLIADRMPEWRRKHKAALKKISEWNKDCKAAKALKQPLPTMPFDAWEECQKDALFIQWIGISLDEITRMKDSREPWIFNRFPLVEERMNRQNCIMWMQRAGYPKPTKSSCINCPYHSNAEWRALTPTEFQRCVKQDERFRSPDLAGRVRTKGLLYLHKSGIPLKDVDLSTEEQRGQLNMFENECEGMCGV